MSAPYTAKTIANELLDLAWKHGVKDMTPIKLQKLVYFAHGWYLAFFQEPLIRQGIQAWKFGPVVADIYHEFKDFGNDPINRMATELAYDEAHGLTDDEPRISADDEDTRGVLQEVWRVYGNFTPIQLANLTHEPGTPWAQINSKYPGELPKNEEIPNALIRKYFEQKLPGSPS